jgi:hypothetical protein
MHFGTFTRGLAIALGLSTLFTSTASAGTISGKTDLVCASVDVVACTKGNCLQGQAHTFDMPSFMFIDVKQKLVRAQEQESDKIESPIKNFEITDEAIILQGFENHRSWSLGIERATGAMTMSSTGAAVSFIVFGNCTEY